MMHEKLFLVITDESHEHCGKPGSIIGVALAAPGPHGVQLPCFHVRFEDGSECFVLIDLDAHELGADEGYQLFTGEEVRATMAPTAAR